MDDLPQSAGTEAGSRSPNFAQRLSRQISRGILPALRNLVRPNRPQRERTRAVPEAEQPSSELTDILNSPQPQETPQPTSPLQPPEPTSCADDGAPENTPDTDNSPPPLVSDDQEEDALSSTSSPMSLSLHNNLIEDDTQNDDSDPNSTSSRQRYRLVVYFEERSPEEQPTARYVAVIVGRLDELQFLLSSSANERGFGDILNNLFTAYTPKGTPPASKDSIDSLPTVTITEHDEKSCMICLEQFAVGTEAVVLPCKHTFHGEECVKTWLKLHNSCPICRYELPVEDAEYESGRKERMLARGFQEAEEGDAAMPDHDHTHDHALDHALDHAHDHAHEHDAPVAMDVGGDDNADFGESLL